DQLRAAPWLVGLPHVSPEFKVRLKITAPDEVIASGFGGDSLGHCDLRILNSRFLSLAAGKRKNHRSDENRFCSQDRHLPGSTSTHLWALRNGGSASPRTISRKQPAGAALNNALGERVPFFLHQPAPSVRFEATMLELEVY